MQVLASREPKEVLLGVELNASVWGRELADLGCRPSPMSFRASGDDHTAAGDLAAG